MSVCHIKNTIFQEASQQVIQRGTLMTSKPYSITVMHVLLCVPLYMGEVKGKRNQMCPHIP